MMELSGLFDFETENEVNSSEILDKAVIALESSALKFSMDVISDAKVRVSYSENIKRIVSEVKEMVLTKKISVKEGAEFCYDMRNQIMSEHRKFTSVQGLARAEKHKKTPPQLDELFEKYAKKKFKSSYSNLTSQQKSAIHYEVISSSGRGDSNFNTVNKRLKVIGRVGVVVTAALATYQILSAENKPKEAVKQGIGIGSGVAGGWLAGLAVSSVCGPGAPVCAIALVLAGSIVGGVLGTVVADTLDEEIEEFTQWKIL